MIICNTEQDTFFSATSSEFCVPVIGLISLQDNATSIKTRVPATKDQSDQFLLCSCNMQHDLQ